MFSPAQSDYVRPQSSGNMSDLHVYVVPLELWDDQQNLAFNQIINETISAGFIRVDAETPIANLRVEIDQQLGTEIIPKDYVFCKSVGRCFAQVRGRQEHILKAKHFLPPNSYGPELFLVDSNVGKRGEKTPESSKTVSSYNNRSFPTNSPPQHPTHDTKTHSDQTMAKESMEREEEEEEVKEKNALKLAHVENDKRLKRESEKYEVERDREKIEENEKYIEMDKEKKLRKDSEVQKDEEEEVMERYDEKFREKNVTRVVDKSDRYVEKDSVYRDLEKENVHKVENVDHHSDARRREIDELQREIMKRYAKLDQIEVEHEMKMTDWKAEEERRQNEEIQRKKKFDQMVLERRKEEEILIAKQKEELKKLEEYLNPNGEVDNESDSHGNMGEVKNRNSVGYTKNDLKMKKDDNDLRASETELRQKEIEIEHELRFNSRSSQTLPDNLKSNLRLEQKEHGYADKMYDRDGLRYGKNEFDKSKQDRERLDRGERHWKESGNGFKENEEHITDNGQLSLSFRERPVLQKIENFNPASLLEGVSQSEEANRLKQSLRKILNEKERLEKDQEEATKKLKQNQLILQTKRNQIKEMWKKKYFDEKNKTPTLEDHLERHKEELENLNKKLLGFMESGFKDHNKILKMNGVMSPSNKANLIIQAVRIRQEIEDLQQDINHCQMRLSAELKLRAQTENELRLLRMEATEKKIRLSRTRSDQLAIMSAGNNALINSYEYVHTPRNVANI